MRYWDASALVPLVIAEPESERVREWLAEDDGIVTWAWTRTEIVSAVERRTREGSLNRLLRRDALDRFEAFSRSWDEVSDMLAVRARACALLARHPLRAADAGQLAAAVLVQEQLGSGLVFACLDGRLSLAAERETLRVIGNL